MHLSHGMRILLTGLFTYYLVIGTLMLIQGGYQVKLWSYLIVHSFAYIVVFRLWVANRWITWLSILCWAMAAIPYVLMWMLSEFEDAPLVWEEGLFLFVLSVALLVNILFLTYDRTEARKSCG